jgi:hypothetical protein
MRTSLCADSDPSEPWIIFLPMSTARSPGEAGEEIKGSLIVLLSPWWSCCLLDGLVVSLIVLLSPWWSCCLLRWGTNFPLHSLHDELPTFLLACLMIFPLLFAPTFWLKFCGALIRCGFPCLINVDNRSQRKAYHESSLGWRH